MNQTINYLLARSRATKRLIALTVDTFVCVASVWLAFYLRLGETVSLSAPLLLAVASSIALAYRYSSDSVCTEPSSVTAGCPP